MYLCTCKAENKQTSQYGSVNKDCTDINTLLSVNANDQL